MIRCATYILGGVLVLTLGVGCDLGMPEDPVQHYQAAALPPGFDPVPIPAHAPLTAARVALGKQLFFDPLLSRDRSVSCASCHLPELAFTDGKPVSEGVMQRTTLRNSPSLINVAYQRLLFWDGGSFSLEAQVIAPLEHPSEMNLPLAEALRRLEQHPTYPARFEEAFGDPISVQTLTLALATYQRTLISSGSAYDRWLDGDVDALSASARRGHKLFHGGAGCATCHTGFLFTDQSFQHNGLVTENADSGRARITLRPEDVGRFRVPSLRNVAITAPYMHDGRYTTLLEVLQHYNRGGDGVRNQRPSIVPLGLSDAELDDIAAFLVSLTDDDLVGP